MEQAASLLESICSKETWTAEDHKELVAQLMGMNDGARRFSEIVSTLESQAPEPKGAIALKLGIARYMLCRFDRALDALSAAAECKERGYYQAQCYKSLRRYDRAQQELEQARKHGWNAAEVDLQIAEVQALAGDLAGGEKALAKAQSHAAQTAEYHYVRGLLHELGGDRTGAVESYEKARQLDPGHAPATFRLAYFCDLNGDEERAVELYRQCLSHPPVYVSALINLAVLHEDAGRYDQAVACLRRVLATNPNHPRARLFLKDAEASRTMFYDEDQARRVAKRNAVLDIPVTDFELSVRARNCLRKMNIRSLGDLVKTTEAELLSYKNFGETSLKEIKEMLTSRGLRLGQAMEEDMGLPSAPAEPKPAPVATGVAATPLAQIEFSVRARKALETLGLRTLGELADKTEAELLACRNFGQTSLNEICQHLAEYGLRLREPS
jgi:DNA-directed RNA polymerase subunit alpha